MNMATWPSTLQLGNNQYEVAILQSCLNEIDNLNLTVDGVFGNNTKAKVQAFQMAHDLTADGIVGPMTWTKIFSSVERYVIRFLSGNTIGNDPATLEDD